MGFSDNNNLKDLAYKKSNFSNAQDFRTKLIYKGIFEKIEDFPDACADNIGVMCSVKNGKTYICNGIDWDIIGNLVCSNEKENLESLMKPEYEIKFTFDTDYVQQQ